MIRRGQMNMKMLLAVLVFIIVLSASFMFLTIQGEKATDGIKDMNLPLPGTYCAGDVGDVPEEVFIKNIRMATKIAWNGKKSCWVKQSVVDDDGNPITIPYSEIYDNITTALDGWGAQGDDCIGGYFGETTPGGTSQIDMVFWWDDKAVCGTNGVITSTISWVQGALGFSRDTLYFHSREDYCIGWALIDWYNPAGNSNIFKYSISKGRNNDDFVCRDESGSGGLDMKLPDVDDLTSMTDANAKTHMINDFFACVQSYKNDFNGGNTGGFNIYLACNKTYLFSPSVDTNLDDVFPSDGAYYDTFDSFSYKTSPCDILDAGLTNPDYSEFNSVSWYRDTTSWHCIYIIVDRLVKTKDEIMNTNSEDVNMLLKDVEYMITSFFYFEDGANDIVITIDTV